MNDILEIYLKAYTSKKAADSVADDIAVGTGSGLFGGLAGYGGGYLHGVKLRKTKGSKIEHALNRIRRRLNDIEFKRPITQASLKRSIESLNAANDRGSVFTPWYESVVKDTRDSLNKLQQAANINNKGYSKISGKASKLQKAIKNSKRLGGVAGAASASILGPILYNTLKKD